MHTKLDIHVFIIFSANLGFCNMWVYITATSTDKTLKKKVKTQKLLRSSIMYILAGYFHLKLIYGIYNDLVIVVTFSRFVMYWKYLIPVFFCVLLQGVKYSFPCLCCDLDRQYFPRQ